MTSPSRTLGVDLASQPKNTAACVIEWEPERRIIALDEILGKDALLDDESLVWLACSPEIEKVAIDAPFGWPVEFVDAVSGWRDSGAWPISLDPEEGQPLLVLRETDREVHRVTELPLPSDLAGPEASQSRRGKRPMSVTTDRIAYAAMRCARILAEIARRDGTPVDRAGGGRVVEVYPDAALREWGVRPDAWDRERVGYKGSSADVAGRRKELMNRLIAAVGDWLSADKECVRRCVANDDELDALVCALMARAAQKGLTRPIANLERATLEGWIHLPEPLSLDRIG